MRLACLLLLYLQKNFLIKTTDVSGGMFSVSRPYDILYFYQEAAVSLL